MKKRVNRSLPRYVFWGNGWGETVWSLLHKQPIRYGIISDKIRKHINIWRIK